MRRNGSRHPIEVLSSGEIVCGHQRVRAAKLLGWEFIECYRLSTISWTRIPTPSSGGCWRTTPIDAMTIWLPELGSHRGSMRSNTEIRTSRSPDPVAICAKRSASSLGSVGREVSRYVKLIAAPIEVQRAVSNKELSLEMAGKISRMPADTQAEIAARIAGGEHGGTVVDEYLPHVPKRLTSPLHDYDSIVKRLKKVLEIPPPPLEELKDIVASESAIEVMEQTIAVCRQLSRWAKGAVARQEPPDPEFVKLVQGLGEQATTVQTADANEIQTTPNQKSNRQRTARRSAKAKPKGK